MSMIVGVFLGACLVVAAILLSLRNHDDDDCPNCGMTAMDRRDWRAVNVPIDIGTSKMPTAARTPPCVIDDLYLHISNGGVTFAVEDNGHGPEVVVTASNHGNGVCKIATAVTPGALRELAKLFDYSTVHTYSPTYCAAARSSADSCARSGDCQSGQGGSIGTVE